MLRQKRALVLPLVVLWVFMAFYWLTGSGHISNGDGEAMYRVACSLIERGWFDITPFFLTCLVAIGALKWTMAAAER